MRKEGLIMYTLDLTQDDLSTISFIGNRYSWSQSLLHLEEGKNSIAESQAWEIKDAIEEDMVGGHDAYPMLDTHSELCDKLHKFYVEIV